ncbi:MAG TPA: deoxyribonuclease IV [Patescibacteria group bacterium]|nr:deoxyribonuclease IV [Patescibacteria group bacterium]
MLKIGCHVSAAGGVFNAPKNAHELGCETFQIFTRPPQGGKAPELTDEIAAKFRAAMDEYGFAEFVVHCPYFVNFGSAEPRIYHGSVSVVRQELERADILGAAYVMTHLGTAKALGRTKAYQQTRQGLAEVLKGYKGKTQFLLEIAAGSGDTIGSTFEDLAELMEPLEKFRAFGGICFDTQHAFASGYDLRDEASVAKTFRQFDKAIGLKYLKMSHANDSKPDLASHKDRHEHIGHGHIGTAGFAAIVKFLDKGLKIKDKKYILPLILETEHDKVKADIKILKTFRDKIASIK